MKKSILYIGEFDFENENVQAHLVKNNGKILTELDYKVFYIGVNREKTKKINRNEIDNLKKSFIDKQYIGLPNTLNVKGIFEYRKIENLIETLITEMIKINKLEYIISYQAPTYAWILKKIVKICKKNNIKYIVNSADIPIFDSQPFIKRLVMKMNWNILHKVNKENADGIIAVSKYIEKFYYKKDRKSIVIPPLFSENIIKNQNNLNEKIEFFYAGTPFVILNHEVKVEGMKDRLDKIIDLMLEVYKKERSIVFKIFGITREDYSVCVPRHSEILSDSPWIEFHGRKSHEETIDELSKADFMLNYRDKNVMTEAGVSTKMVESVSVGTPVIMNNIGDAFNYLIEGESGIELTGDIDVDSKTIIKLCKKDPDERRMMKLECKNKKTFHWKKYVEPVKDFLKMI